MFKRLTYILALLTLLPAALLGAVSLDVKCSRSTVFHGESFNLTLSVQGADSGIEQPDFAGSSPAEIQFLGSYNSSRSSIRIINGRVTRNIFRGRQYSYSIKPVNKGIYKTGQIAVKVKGKIIKDAGVSVQVTGVEQQENVIISVQSSSKSVLVEEPFSITLSIAVKDLPAPYGKSNESVHPDNKPQITADFLNQNKVANGLKQIEFGTILNKLIDQRGNKSSFYINNHSDGWNRPVAFRLPCKQITINGKNYREYSIKINYIATSEGEYTFGPVTFKGPVMSNVKLHSNKAEAVFKNIYAIGAAETVRVTPPPDKGQPDNFIGSVGKNMQASAEMDTTICKEGDPLTLTLEITGEVSIANMRTPTLGLQPELTRDFRIYDENVKAETLKNGKRFTYRVRPTKAGTLEFPPVIISYYNTDLMAYKTTATDPIPIQAHTTTQIAAVDNQPNGSNGTIKIRKTQPYPSGITLIPEGTQKHSLIPDIKIFLPLLLGMPLLVLLTILFKPLRSLAKRAKSNRIRSGALSTALRLIVKANSVNALSHSVRNYLTNRLDLPGHSLTGRELENILIHKGASKNNSCEFSNLIAQLDEAMYKPGSENQISLMKKQCTSALHLIDRDLHNSRSERKENA